MLTDDDEDDSCRRVAVLLVLPTTAHCRGRDVSLLGTKLKTREAARKKIGSLALMVVMSPIVRRAEDTAMGRPMNEFRRKSESACRTRLKYDIYLCSQAIE